MYSWHGVWKRRLFQQVGTEQIQPGKLHEKCVEIKTCWLLPAKQFVFAPGGNAVGVFRLCVSDGLFCERNGLEAISAQSFLSRRMVKRTPMPYIISSIVSRNQRPSLESFQIYTPSPTKCFWIILSWRKAVLLKFPCPWNSRCSPEALGMTCLLVPTALRIQAARKIKSQHQPGLLYTSLLCVPAPVWQICWFVCLCPQSQIQENSQLRQSKVTRGLFELWAKRGSDKDLQMLSVLRLVVDHDSWLELGRNETKVIESAS